MLWGFLKYLFFSRKLPSDGFERWIAILYEEKKDIHRFDLFGTRAAFLSNKGDDEIYVVCLNSFNKEKPNSREYNYFTYNLKNSYWLGRQPRGAANRIKEEIKASFKTGGGL